MAWTVADAKSALNTIFAETGSPALRRLLSEVVNGRNLAALGMDITYTELHNRNDASASFVNVTDATTYTVLAANAGKVHFLPDFTAACTITLPAAAVGLEFPFVYVGGALDAHGFVIKSGSDTNYYTGGVIFHDMDAGAGSDETSAVYPDGNSNSMITATSVGAGTVFTPFCRDGTLWTIKSGRICGNTAPTFADNS